MHRIPVARDVFPKSLSRRGIYIVQTLRASGPPLPPYARAPGTQNNADPGLLDFGASNPQPLLDPETQSLTLYLRLRVEVARDVLSVWVPVLAVGLRHPGPLSFGTPPSRFHLDPSNRRSHRNLENQPNLTYRGVVSQSLRTAYPY